MDQWCLFFAVFCGTVAIFSALPAEEFEIQKISSDNNNNANQTSASDKDVYTAFLEANETMETYFILKEKLDIYDPGRLTKFLEKNASKISESCARDVMTYLSGLKDGKPWAIKILDATGSYSSNFLYGNHYWLGSQTACLDLLHPKNKNDSPPFQVHFYSAKYLIALDIPTIRKPMQFITFGLCLPQDCTKSDLTTLLGGTSTPSASLKNVRPVPDVNYNFYFEPIGIALLGICAIGFLLVLAGTAYEIYTERRQQEALEFEQGQRNKKIGQSKDPEIKVSTVEKLRFYVNHNVEGHGNDSNIHYKESTNSINSTTSSASVSSFDSTDQKIGIGAQIILCFSFKRNFKKICNVKTTDSLACVHGLRVFSLLWVIAGHTCMITMPFVDNVGFRIIVERDFLFQSISNGAFSVDTFFFISGLLISYVFNKAEREKNTGSDQTTSSHAKISLLKFVGGVTYRLIRLTPPYLVVLILTYLTGRWFYFNSVFDPPVGDHFTCPQYWWRNVLYINTLFPVNQMCMIWSWYLADDTQFYFLGLIILLISSRYSKFASISSVVLLISSVATTAIITLLTQHKPSIEEPLGLFDQLYDKPWTRLAPYIIGMAVGYYLARVNCKATFNKGLVALGWVLSMITTFILVHGLYGELGHAESAAYVSLSHTAWALAISWIVIACVTGYGGPVNKILSSKFFAPLSRLTYCAYLIHPLVMLSSMAHMDGPYHLQRDTMIMAIFGYFVVSYLGSIVLTILFEAPAVALLNIFHPLKKKIK